MKDNETSNVEEVECHQSMKRCRLGPTATGNHVPQGLMTVENALRLASGPRGPQYDDTLSIIFHVDRYRTILFNGGVTDVRFQDEAKLYED